ncbi:hypothetical protein V7O62_10555 [Methanolobus sp. ZRKC2]|uniref:hypothetical protein n=1 Tax=Methanolobus sp. ZRKC2 TaxID=3125783 RepID=UPI00324940B9
MQIYANKTKNIDLIGIFLFFLGISGALINYFVYSNRHYSFLLILFSLIALISSIKILSQNNLPVLKLLVGVILAVALFSQAYFIQSLYSAILGIIMLLASAIEYRRDMAKTK